MNKKTFCLAALMALFLCSCAKHFITDADYRDAVHSDFVAREGLMPEGLRLDTLTDERREAMEFLYAYMPYSDLADYEPAFFLDQVDCAFRARGEFAWGESVPEDIFRHFVLVYRVNNENLDTARRYFLNQIGPRIQGMSMTEAALEVNHWCHEHVAYRAADGRTSAPLATLRTSLGRCGEESTFAVTALRAVGIPARQCYTPRWAHCDDNHAWVEVWTDGAWHYMGACEPDPELDMGWFTIPSTRTMMVHTKVFGRYRGDEEVVLTSGLYSELNLTGHYADTRRITATVVDDNGKPLPGVHIKFKLYNYAEYYTLADYLSDDKGQASLTTGLGDLLVWATDGTRYGFAKIDVRQSDNITLRLDHAPGDCYTAELTIVPPVADSARLKLIDSPENARRLAYEDSLRGAYTATFPTEANYLDYVSHNENMTDDELREILLTSEGNYAEVARFLNSHQKREPGLFLYDYMRSFSDKDLRDTPAELFEHHLTHYDGSMPEEVYKKGIMPARISNELVREWRNIGDFVESAVDDTGNYYNCPISPRGVERLRVADRHSRDIYYVACCRAHGIPAYLDAATNIIYRYENGAWQRQTAARAEQQESALVELHHNGTEYYINYTVQQLEDGDFVSYDFEGDARLAESPTELPLVPGTYCLSRGIRSADGSVASTLEVFTLGEGERRVLDCEPKTDLFRPDFHQAFTLTLELGPHREPSKHVIVELLAATDRLNHLFSSIEFRTADPGNAELRRLAAKVPVVSIIDCQDYDPARDYPQIDFRRDGTVLYHAAGYQIGVVNQIFWHVK